MSVALNVAVADVATMDARLSGPDTSLNAPLSADADGQSAERMDLLVSDAPLPDEVVGEAIDSERRELWLRSALTTLSDRELRIIHERRLQDEGATLEALGAKLGISKERVRQIEGRALEKLRDALVRQHPEIANAA